MSNEMGTRSFEKPDGARIAFAQRDGTGPTVVFLSGYASNMAGSKALWLDAWATASGQRFLRFDYQGHGASSGHFEDGTIGTWFDDARTLVESVTEGPLVLVGSSMGGWMALLLARALAERVAGIVTIAPAPDFTRRMLETELSSEARAELAATGQYRAPSEYDEDGLVFTAKLLEEGASHSIFDAPYALRCPFRIMHGDQDESVPWEEGLRLYQHVEAADSRIVLVKHGDHRLSSPAHLDLLRRLVEEVIDSA